MRVDILIPCFVDQVYPESAWNMIKILEHLGCKVFYNEQQTCCGQPSFNSGYWDEAKVVAEKLMDELVEDHYLVVQSSSCTGMIRNYYEHFFKNGMRHKDWKSLAGRTYEFTEFLVKVLKVTDIGSTFEGKATYHDSCAALRECNVSEEPKMLLSHVKGLELISLPNNTVCCGFGGTFAVKYEPISTAMAEQKVQAALKTGADYLISSDLSCLMHLDGYIKKHNLNIKSLHIADVLASGLGIENE